MTTKIKSIDDCVSGRDYIEFAQANEWEMIPNGSYLDIYDGNGKFVTRVPDAARCLPKETRATINAALVKAGLLVALLAAVMAAVL
jgi:hypothetical protein